ncbi:MAG: SMI1/KNR4 family protein [Deltaproteobacteria bacterium]|nr:SMI1/KNR4 family protein [Deltaproteobacteria bacterium]
MSVDAHDFMKRYRRALTRKRLVAALTQFYGPLPTWIGTHRWIFGARWHQFSVGKRLSSASIEAFESKWNIELPEDYRSFLLEVGDGGAGPYYGIAPLAEWCQPDSESEFAADALKTPFDPDVAANATTRSGFLRIVNAGCEYYYVLVVSGPHKGQVWLDGSVDGIGFKQLIQRDGRAVSLKDWLEIWFHRIFEHPLDWSEVLDPFWTSSDFPGHAIARTLADNRGIATVAADQLPCPACVRRLTALDHPVRMIVSSLDAKSRSNPKSAAMLAASSGAKCVPRPAFP